MTAQTQPTERLSELAKSVTLTSEYGQIKRDWDKLDKWQQEAHNYRCTLRYRGRQYSFDFFMGPANTNEPSVEDCLDCLLSDAQAGESTFEDFCSEMGYEADSRRAERTHKACQKTAVAMRRLLGDDYERFLYADRN